MRPRLLLVEAPDVLPAFSLALGELAAHFLESIFRLFDSPSRFVGDPHRRPMPADGGR